MIEAKKSLGQNFLRDEKILAKIVDFAQIENQNVVEVGPGEGTLTKLLLEKAKKVIAIEKDERMVEFLKIKFEREIKDNRLQIIVRDVLELEAESLELRGKEKASSSQLKPLSYVLVGNIPYYITGALFKKVLESENPPSSITFVVQKEVAERIIARDAKESILSISVKAYGIPEYGGTIKAGSFYPVPKVDSGIIAVRNISKGRFKKITHPDPLLLQEREPGTKKIEQKFFEIVRAGFAHKRKLLIKNLESVFQTSDKTKLKEIFKTCGLHEKARAEDLKVEDWFCLVQEAAII